MREVTRQHGLLLNWHALVAALVMLLVCVILLWISEEYAAAHPIACGKVLPAFAAVIGTSGIFAIAYEILVRRQQTRYVLEALELRESLVRTGLDDVTTNYMDYNYAAQIAASSEITVFALYAQTWFARYSVELQKHLESSGKSVILCLPSFENPFLPALASQFRMEPDDLKKKIAESIAAFVQPALSGRLGKNSRVQVIQHMARPAYSAYKFDGRMLIGTYYASSARRRAPMFEFIDVPGSMYEEFADDLKQVQSDDSTVVFDSSDQTNNLVESLGALMPQQLSRAIEKAKRKSAEKDAAEQQ